MPTLSQARRRTTLVLKGQPLPECFADATLAATLNAYERNATKSVKRRLSGKVVRIEAIELGEVR